MFTVVGVVVSRSGSPRSFMPVVINGTQLVVTDFLGTFTAPGVAVPYSAAVIDPVRPQATIYQGLTRPDPTLRMHWEENTNQGGHTGQVSGGVGYPLPANHTTSAHVFGARNVGIGSSVSPTTGAVSSGGLTATWSGAASAPAGLLVLQRMNDAMGNVVNFTGFGVGVATLQDGLTVPFPPMMLAPIGTMQLTGTISLPAGFNFFTMQTNVIITPALKAQIDTTSTDPGGTFAVRAPTIPNATFEVFLRANDGAGRDVNARAEVPAFATGITLAPPAPHALVSPADGAMGVDHNTVFSCTPSVLGVHLFNFFGGNVPSRYMIISASPQITIPDLSAFGLRLGSNQLYAWRADAVGPYASVDEMAGGPGLYPSGVVGYFAFPVTRTITTAP